MQFLDGLLVPVGKLVVQELFDDGRFAHPSRTHHHHSPPDLHDSAAADSAAATGATR